MDKSGLDKKFDLTPLEYFADFILVPITIILMMHWQQASVPEILMLVAGGFVLWTLVEYWIHRSIFHGNTRYEPMHQLHHALPKDMIGVASVGTFAGFTGLFCSCWMLSCFDTAASITTGFMVGYLFYCAIHVRMHHGDRSKYGRYMAYMFKHHAGHHRGGKGNFGVTTPIWDMAFGSYQKGSNNQASRV